MAATVYQFRVAQSDEACNCYKCGVEFASPIIERRRRDGESFWCPNGHSQAFTKTTEQQLRERLQREQELRKQAENDAEWARAEAKTARTQETRAKNKLKRVETRVKAGVCPCCNRTFQNLARHMKTQHKS